MHNITSFASLHAHAVKAIEYQHNIKKMKLEAQLGRAVDEVRTRNPDFETFNRTP